MLEKLKKEVYDANMYIYNNNLITLTWGNASGIDETRQYMVIKPSGVDYKSLKVDDMVVVSILTKKVIEGSLNPSSDTDTHIELYRSFSKVKGIVHTHSTWATINSQLGRSLKALGTTHADTFYGSIPCTRKLRKKEVENEYELNTGKVIVETFKDKNYMACPAVYVNQHGPFTWGESALEAAKVSLILEEVSKMGYYTKLMNPSVVELDDSILDKHYNRKHGRNSYYGQKEKK